MEFPSAVAACDPVISAYCARMSTASKRSAWDATALRAGSVAAREVVARQASGLGFGLDSILALAAGAASAHPRPDVAEAWQLLQFEHLVRLARMLAVQRIEAGDMRRALDIYRGILRARRHGALPKRHLVLATELAIALHEYTLAEELLHRLPWKSSEYLHLRCDLANPFVVAHGADEAGWMALFDRFFVESGVDAPMLEDNKPEAFPFDRLAVPLEPGSVRGPLVTVMMSSWCPDGTLETAIDSLLKQTWADLEILLIDDASPVSYQSLLQRVASKDARIRLISQDTNQGTYVARNRGLAEASGEFFTVQDSDDWAHPARIERQVRQLLDNERLVAGHCKGIRTNDFLQFNLPGVPPARANESSLLFRAAPVRERIGYYDASRKGADTEYSLRLRRSFGEQAYEVLPGILTAIRLSRGSLSREEFKPGWRHPARAAYRRGFETWHESRLPEGRGLMVERAASSRKFTLPSRFRVEQGGGPNAYDYLLIGDLTADAPLSRVLHDEMTLLANGGARVGIMHLPSFERPVVHAVERFWLPIRRAIDRGVVEEVMSSDSGATRRLLVMDPAILQFAARGRSQLSAAEAYLVAPSGIFAPDGLPAFDPRVCEEWVRVMYGCQARWIPRDRHVRESLRGVVPASQLAHACWPVDVHPAAWRTPARPGPRSFLTPRIALELDRRRPLAEQIAFYGGLTEVPARVWMETSSAGGGELPGRWIAAARRSEKSTLMATSDVWLHLEPAADGILPRGPREAMIAGCLPILHESWRDLVGPGAMYLDQGAGPLQLDRLLADRDSVDAVLVAIRGMLESIAPHDFSSRIDRIAAGFPQ